MIQFRDYKGNLVDAPSDLPQFVTSHEHDLVVWSRDRKTHQIRYGLEVQIFEDSIQAAAAFGYAVHHVVQCDGKLD